MVQEDNVDANPDIEPELPDALYQIILGLSQQANAALDANRPLDAVDPLQQALDLLPYPQPDYEAWTWLNATLGEAYFLGRNYALAKISLYDAMSGPDGMTNPFVLLRLGQSLFELNELQQAKNKLAQAHMLQGDGLFGQEDPKYLKFLLKQ